MNTLNTWYNSKLASYADDIDTNVGFCRDRNLQSGNWSSTGSHNYAAYGRLVSAKTPTLECSNTNDIYTTKVGLITADEVSMAGGVYGTSNSSYYLYTGQYYWTMSPSGFTSTGTARVFCVISTGNLSSHHVAYARGVRPVLNLSADITLTGEGTQSNPYVVS